ncbi:MAG: ParB/RepB/Spo0J family partition protein [Bacillota bacterium]|nr:ParB/RepB/Spo0J family partition protein [Bacillota bacterium]
MNKKHGLGRGLSSLIPDGEEEDNSIQKISLNKIKPNSQQPRKIFNQEKIIELASSIKEHGIIQPLVLKQEEENYIIIAGERRWRAAKYLNLQEVPAVIMDISDEELLQVSLIENIQREDLNPIEEALAYDKLINQFNLTQEELSEKVGKSRPSIANSLRLLNLDSRVRDYIIQGLLSEGHGRAILGLKDKNKQFFASKKVISNKLSVRDTEKLVKNLELEKEVTVKEVNPFINDIKSRLEGYFGTKVSLNSNKDKGKIEIEYYSSEDLERILNLLNL